MVQKIKTHELIGSQLDWVVAKCEGFDTRNNVCVWFLPFEADSGDLLQFICMADDEAHAEEQCEDAHPNCTVENVEHLATFKPSTDWSQGGPIIERERMNVHLLDDKPDIWSANLGNPWKALPNVFSRLGPTPLIAAMRCYVASKLGEEITL